MAVLLTKNEALRQVVNVICGNGLCVDDVIKMLKTMPPEQQFDVAILTGDDGTVERLPLNTGADMYPIGIYPFKVGPFSQYYLELTEDQPGLTRKQAKSRCKGGQELPSSEFWACLDGIVPQLNQALEMLHGAAVSGSYYTKMPCIWTIGQGESCHNPSIPAKSRYIVRK